MNAKFNFFLQVYWYTYLVSRSDQRNSGIFLSPELFRWVTGTGRVKKGNFLGHAKLSSYISKGNHFNLQKILKSDIQYYK